jgi:hypothetical protein
MYRAVMQVKNTGSVMAEFCFVPKLNETEVSKSWLKFSPMDGILAPEETCEVEVLVILNLEEAYEIATTKANVSLMWCVFASCAGSSCVLSEILCCAVAPRLSILHPFLKHCVRSLVAFFVARCLRSTLSADYLACSCIAL